MTQVRSLHDLQLVDSERFRVLKALREAEASLGESTEVRQARAKLQKEEESLGRWRAQMHSLDLEIKGLNDKIEQTQQRLYSGVVRNPKELGNLQKDLQYLRERRDTLEDELLEAMTQVDDAEARTAKAQATSSELDERWRSRQEELASEISRLKQSITALDERRRELRSTIDGSDLSLYDQLIAAKRGLAVTTLNGDLCGGCRVLVPTGVAQRARRGEEVTVCNTCGRIIVPD